MFAPKLVHEVALKRIGKNLNTTRDKGLILNLSGTLQIDAYPDMDFAGPYGYLKITDPVCVKSRMGFLITVSDCPMVWVSKLQTKTALSMIKTEIVALTHCCLELFPVCDIVKKVGKVVGLATDNLSLMHGLVHEDNAGALELAEKIPPEFTP
ncbi:hypothetical protein ACHAW6_002191 [Cyclotella cf. meneghiniana]